MALAFIATGGLVWALHGTGAADYVSRSGRGPAGRITGYLELHFPVLLLTIWTAVVVVMTIIMNGGNVTGGPPWGLRLIPLAALIAVVSLAHVGLARRWRWWMRVGGYLLCFTAVAGTAAHYGIR
jgi:hypothetical protein